MDALLHDSITFIIMGASGDLTKRKLIPSIYALLHHKKIKSFAIIGAALTDTTAEEILEKAAGFIPDKKPEIWQQLVDSFSYHKADFYRDSDYQNLHEQIIAIEKEKGLAGNRIFYFATMPEHFAPITNKLAIHGMAKRNGHKQTPWTRVVYEKPFGNNFQSAQAINEQIARVFHEEQVFRIIHYLGKEIVGNIALIRFTNLFFQPLWNNQYIESVEIGINEKIGIEGRGEYYDRNGILKDVVQNHLLQMLALVAMEPPEKLIGESIRDEKAKVLKKTKVESVLLGQYEGYKEENCVNPVSKTATFAALKLSIDNDRWRGVPFFLKTGKSLPKKEAAIHIKFRQSTCLLTENCPVDSNYLTISIEPDEGFFLEINAKKPGLNYAITPVTMNFCHKSLFGPNTTEAYEALLTDVIRGDQSVFVRADEIEHAWKIIGNIDNSSVPYPYAPGSQGPQELQVWSDKMKIRWRS
ncbi:glucose-6-phosphate dehydrogenase [Candidatus Babeliales bacterium]|nr:glucose-6-phosphate dehydrogenase [Candidatus Babeliales bacterium]